MALRIFILNYRQIFLTKKEIEYVRTFRDGLVQFEIGVQFNQSRYDSGNSSQNGS